MTAVAGSSSRWGPAPRSLTQIPLRCRNDKPEGTERSVVLREPSGSWPWGVEPAGEGGPGRLCEEVTIGKVRLAGAAGVEHVLQLGVGGGHRGGERRPLHQLLQHRRDDVELAVVGGGPVLGVER